MAETVTGRQLTQSYRQLQAAAGAETVGAMRAVWPLLDPSDLDGTFGRWAQAALAVIGDGRAVSARLTAAYMAAFKMAEIGGQVVPVLAGPVAPGAATTSMLVTGPVSIRSALARGVALSRAVAVAEAGSAAAAVRHALDGGRETVTATVSRDRDATGYMRVASAGACSYCVGLAGIRFRTSEVFRPHDGCRCTAEPIY